MAKRHGGEESAAAPVAIIMGSDSDWEVMREAYAALLEVGVAADVEVVSAHRTPDKLFHFARAAADRGVRVIIAGAGGAAHLPGMVAAMTTLPVIGVPVPLRQLDGLDSLLSIVQMPGGIPVATVSIGGAKNAGLLAARILGSSDPEIAAKLGAYADELRDQVEVKNESLQRKVASVARAADGPASKRSSARRAAGRAGGSASSGAAASAKASTDGATETSAEATALRPAAAKRPRRTS